MKVEDAIAEIKSRINIVDVIGKYVALKQRGHNFIGLCPFHREKTPSFYVHADKGFFKCFGCSAAGDVIAFQEKVTGQLFLDVVRDLAAGIGIELDGSKGRAAAIAQKQPAISVTAAAQVFFSEALTASSHAQEIQRYLFEERALSNKVAQLFGVGFGGDTGESLQQALRIARADESEALRLGLLQKGKSGVYSTLTGRVTLPIRNTHGEVVGFGGRQALGASLNGPKYLNSATSDIYNKSSILYGLFESLARLKKGWPVVLVEGYFDVLSVFQAGFPAVAPCGTSLTEKQVLLLKKYTQKVILCFDSDRAGEQAQERALKMLLEQGFRVYCADLEELKDPDQYGKTKGVAGLRDMLKRAQDALLVEIERAKWRTYVGMAQRVAAIESLLELIATIDKPLLRRQYVAELAKAFQEEAEVLHKELSRLGRKRTDERVPEMGTVRQKGSIVKWSGSEQLLARALIAWPKAVLSLDRAYIPQLNLSLQQLLSGFLQADQLLLEEPLELLKAIAIPNDPTLINLLMENIQSEELMSCEDAKKIVESFVPRSPLAQMKKLG